MITTKNKTKLYFMIALLTIVIIGVGYAILTTTLNINGKTIITKTTWDIHFENLDTNVVGSVTDLTTTPTKESLTEESKTTAISYSATLSKPGDSFTISVDVVNKGSIDAMIESVTNNGLTEEQQRYIDYTVTYSDGIEISPNQLLAVGEREKIELNIKFKEDIEASDLPVNGATLNLTFSLNYQQAEKTAIAVRQPICKRATTLHKETCSQTDPLFYCSESYGQGSKVTYGNQETTSGVLKSGDAFDCDVNGDGKFNSENERFYYVTDLEENSQYAVLIYYNNVSGGQPNNTLKFAYDTSDSPRTNGPITAIEQLPTTSQWRNVSLSNTTRTLKDEKNGTHSSFDYTGRSARLLTYQEVNSTCNNTLGTEGGDVGALDTCQYLMENTRYTDSRLTDGYWLESPCSFATTYAWNVDTMISAVGSEYVSYKTYYGVRPAIEVEKFKISY